MLGSGDQREGPFAYTDTLTLSPAHPPRQADILTFNDAEAPSPHQPECRSISVSGVRIDRPVPAFVGRGVEPFELLVLGMAVAPLTGSPVFLVCSSSCDADAALGPVEWASTRRISPERQESLRP